MDNKVKQSNIKLPYDSDKYDSIVDLRVKVAEIRKEWFKGSNERQDNTYTPSVHDKIKFNINMYLGQTCEFFLNDIKDANVLLLDSNDLGTTSVLKAYDFDEKNVYLPNWYNKSTEYGLIHERLPSVSAYPVTMDQMIDSIVESKDVKDFNKRLRAQYDEDLKESDEPETYKFEPMMAAKPDKLNMAYLDFNNELEKPKLIFRGKKRHDRVNMDTVEDVFDKKLFESNKPFVFAVTGSMYAYPIRTLNRYLDYCKNKIIEFAETNGYDLRVDQYFVYNRSHQEGEVEENIGHRNIDHANPSRPFSDQSSGTKMFFMSFIGNASQERLDAWDRLFESCDDNKCKLELSRKSCLYQKGYRHDGRVVLRKPFCNARITDFYIYFETIKQNMSQNDIIHLYQSIANYRLPWLDAEVSNSTRMFLNFFNIKTHRERIGSLYDSYKKDMFDEHIIPCFDKRYKVDFLDVDVIIEDTNAKRLSKDPDEKVYFIDSVHDIQNPFSDTLERVNISVVSRLDTLIGVHFENIEVDVLPKISSACIYFPRDLLDRLKSNKRVKKRELESDIYDESDIQPSDPLIGKHVSVRYSMEDDQGNVIVGQYQFYEGMVVRKQRKNYYWIKWDNGDPEDLVNLPEKTKDRLWFIVDKHKRFMGSCSTLKF